MKHLFFLFAISLPLLLIGCSNNEQELLPLSPDVSEPILQVDKTSGNLTQPYPLYQTFPEMKDASVNWFNNAKGLVIKVSSQKAATGVQLFAILHFADVDPVSETVKMVYLGNSSKGTYIVRELKNRIVSSIRIYFYNNRNLLDRPEPYPEYQLFQSIGIKGWSSGQDAIKISTEKFPANLKHIFAELTSRQRNTLIYLGKPWSEDFEFPKSPDLRVNNVRLVGYVTKSKGYDSYPIVSQQ